MEGKMSWDIERLTNDWRSRTVETAIHSTGAKHFRKVRTKEKEARAFVCVKTFVQKQAQHLHPSIHPRVSPMSALLDVKPLYKTSPAGP